MAIGLHRTLRIPEDGRPRSVPSGLGMLPVFRIEDYAARVPGTWERTAGFFVPLRRCEALWIAFAGRWWRPHAISVAADGLNVVTGGPVCEGLAASPQDYVVVPDQVRLWGVNLSKGLVRQFALGPPGLAQPDSKCLSLTVYRPKPGRFRDLQPGVRYLDTEVCCMGMPAPAGEPVLNGREGSRQKIYADEYGIDTWDVRDRTHVCVYLVSVPTFVRIVGEEPPPTPITEKEYARRGLPWLATYAEQAVNGSCGG